MNSTETKGLCLALFFIDTLLFGWPPYFLVRNGSQSRRAVRIRNVIISVLKCFAGGVFLGACLLHLLAEGRESMEDYFQAAGADVSFPVYEAVVAVGFFAIALVEKLAHHLLKGTRQVQIHAHQTPPGEPASVATITQGDPSTFTLQSSHESALGQQNGWDNPVHAQAMNGHYEVSNENRSVSSRMSSLKEGPHERYEVSAQDSVSVHEHGDQMVEVAQAMEGSPLRAFLLLAALSFHTIFDGLAVGLQTSDVHIWEMFTAICIHKTLVAVCLGLQLFLAFRSKPIKAFIWVFIFALIAPVGIGLGMILTSGHIDALAEGLVNWLLQGLATGTFLYVTVFEILLEEFQQNGRIINIFIAMLGFGGMVLAKYFDKD